MKGDEKMSEKEITEILQEYFVMLSKYPEKNNNMTGQDIAEISHAMIELSKEIVLLERKAHSKYDQETTTQLLIDLIGPDKEDKQFKKRKLFT